jgi:hypothetical protein
LSFHHIAWQAAEKRSSRVPASRSPFDLAVAEKVTEGWDGWAVIQAQSRNGALCKVGAGNFHGFKYRWQDNDYRICIGKVAASFFIPQY